MRPAAAAWLVAAVVPAAAFHPQAVGLPAGLHALGVSRPSLQVRRTPPCAVVASAPELDDRQLDLGSLGRYLFAVLIQMLFITTALGVFDVAAYGPLPDGVALGGPLPWQAVVGIFLALSLRSRVFNPLDNARPELRGGGVTADDDAALRADLEAGKMKLRPLKEAAEKRGLVIDNTMDRPELQRVLATYLEAADADGGGRSGARERIMPSWTPPGVTFPLMWVGVVAPLRAFSSSLVYEASTGRLNEAHLDDPVLLWLVLHLCLGDTWNTINNVEGRTGAAVPAVAVVWLSTVFAAKQYYDVVPLAGYLLGATSVWILVAGALVADTWRINNEVAPEPLYPYKKKGYKSKTRLWIEDFEGI